MLNQESIGQFRKILSWVMKRSGKTCSVVDETNTTKECSICCHLEKKDSSIREIECLNCNIKLNRDINSGVNITKKDSLLSGLDLLEWDLSHPRCTARSHFRKSKISIANI